MESERTRKDWQEFGGPICVRTGNDVVQYIGDMSGCFCEGDRCSWTAATLFVYHRDERTELVTDNSTNNCMVE